MRILCQNCLREVDISVDQIEKDVECPYCKKKLDTSLQNPMIRRKIKTETSKPKSPARKEVQQKEQESTGKQGAQPQILNFTCPKCSTSYKLPATKVPRSGEFKLTCKNCGTVTVTSYPKLTGIEDNEPEPNSPDLDAVLNRGDGSNFPQRPGQLKGRRGILDDSNDTEFPENKSSENLSQKTSSTTKSIKQSNLDSQRRESLNPESSNIAPQIAPPEDGRPRYFTKSGDEVFGPLRIEELEKWAEQGLLHPDDNVAKAGSLYQPAKNIPELKMHFGSREINDTGGAAFGLKDDDEGWTFNKMLKAILAGVLGGIAHSVIMILWSMLSCRLAIGAALSVNPELTYFMAILIQFIMWTVMGAFLGALFSVIEGLFFAGGDDGNIWSYRNNWIGVTCGVVIGFFFMLFGGIGLFGLLGFAISFLILNSLIVFAYKTFFTDDDISDF
ncbi:MAG: zinc-ribbon domain-containing protein [Candidatus Zixiibacteriota bacterium]